MKSSIILNWNTNIFSYGWDAGLQTQTSVPESGPPTALKTTLLLFSWGGYVCLLIEFVDALNHQSQV